MNVNIKLEYHLILTGEELRLVSAALHCGLSEEQKPEALALQKRLVELKLQHLVGMTKQVEGTLNAINHPVAKLWRYVFVGTWKGSKRDGQMLKALRSAGYVYQDGQPEGDSSTRERMTIDGPSGTWSALKAIASQYWADINFQEESLPTEEGQ